MPSFCQFQPISTSLIQIGHVMLSFDPLAAAWSWSSGSHILTRLQSVSIRAVASTPRLEPWSTFPC